MLKTLSKRARHSEIRKRRCAASIELGGVDADLVPDPAWVEARLARKDLPPVKMVVVVNPGNPTGQGRPRCVSVGTE